MKEFIKKVFLTIKDFLLEWRKTLTISSALVGLGLAWLVLKCQVTESIFGFVEDDILIELKKGLFLIVLATPTSYYLWFLRNEDKLVQLKQQEENNQFNSFSAALRLFTEKGNLEANAVGLKLLMKIRNVDKVYVDQIDLATPHKVLTNEKLPMKAKGVKLSGAELSKVKLMRADLTGAVLTGAILTDADLSKADLTGATLIGTNLTDANLTGAILKDAALSLPVSIPKNENQIDSMRLLIAERISEEFDFLKLKNQDPLKMDFSDMALNLVDIYNANLTRANLTDADITGANLTGANLTNARIWGIRLTINKQDFTTDEIDHEFLKKDFGKVTDPMRVRIVRREKKYYLEKIEGEELEEGI